MNHTLVITDIHGTPYYLNKLNEKHPLNSFDNILILGDILYHGPRNDLPLEYNPKEVIKILNPLSLKIIAVQGNCDAEVDQMVLTFPIRKSYFYRDILLTHGHHIDECEYEGFVLYGHTHVNKIDGKYINIGSLSIPKDGHHTYAIIEGNKLTVYDLMTDEVIMEELI